MDVEANRQRALEFVTLLGAGRAGELTYTADFRAWSILSGDIPGSDYLSRTKIFARIFKTPLQYQVESTTTEADRVVVQCRGSGVLVNDAAYTNTYVFVFRFEDGRIASVAEYFNVQSVLEVLIPVMRAAAAKA